MKNNYFSLGLSRSIFCWLSMLLLGSLAPAGLMAQTTLSTGDIAFVGFNGVDDQSNGNSSNDKFSFVLLKDVTANTRIFFTDFGWLTGGGFQTVSPTAGVGSKDDGIISWTSSTSLAAGTQVVILCKYNLSANTGTVAGVEQVPAQSFFMNIGDPGADNIFAYQAATARDANPTLLAGIRTAGVATTWDATLDNNTFTSAGTTLPASLTANGVNAALYLRGSFYTIAIYKCTVNSAFPRAIRNAINNPANWEYPNPGTFCEGYIYAPSDPDCPQGSIPAGYNLPINCTFAVTQVQIATQPVSRTVCAGQPVSFTSTASNATAFQWQVSTNGGGSFGNLSNGGVYAGVTSTILTISNTTGFNGYQYRLIASESTEPSSATSSAAILTVNNGPQNLVLTPSGPLSCTSTTVTLTATSTGATSYSFSGPGITAQGSATATVNTAGSYSVVATSASGCTAVATTSITVSEDKNAPTMPTLTASPSTTLTCAQTSLTLTASATGIGLSYAFSGPGGSLAGTGNSRVVSVAGMYSVTITGANGCTTSQSTVIYSNTIAPTPTLTASNTAVCEPASITLTAGGGVSYTFSAGASQIASTNLAVVTQSGVYSVTVAGANGCTSTTSITVAINPRPSAPTLTGASRSIIQSNTPLSLLGFVTAANGNTLSFSGLTGLLNPPTVDISQTGVLNFQVTQTNISGCTSLATPFSLTIQPSIPANQTVCRSSVVVLSSITPGNRFEWYKNGQSAPFRLTEIASIQKGTQTASLTIVSAQTTASYYLKIFAANGSFVFEGPFRVAVDYSCTARQAAPELADVPLSVVLMPNPIADGQVRAVVRGAGGQFLRVTLLNLQGQPAGEQHWTIAEPEQTIELSTAGQPSGMYLLQAQTPGQRTIVKVIKP